MSAFDFYDTSILVTGKDTKKLENLARKAISHTEKPHENDIIFGHAWLGNVLLQAGISQQDIINKYDGAAGQIYYIDSDNEKNVLLIKTESEDRSLPAHVFVQAAEQMNLRVNMKCSAHHISLKETNQDESKDNSSKEDEPEI